MKKYFLQHKKGFTLVETMIAVSILMIALLGPLDIASTSLKNSNIAKDQITAYYLAQEGLEYVRFVRDSNAISTVSGTDWLDGLIACKKDPSAPTDYGCMIDVSKQFTAAPATITACAASGCLPLKIDSSGYYTYSVSAPTTSKFTRTITISANPPNGSSNFNNENTTTGKEVKVSVNVSWKQGNITKQVTLSENIFNIYFQQ